MFLVRLGEVAPALTVSLADSYELHLVAVLLLDDALRELARHDDHGQEEDHREQHAEAHRCNAGDEALAEGVVSEVLQVGVEVLARGTKDEVVNGTAGSASGLDSLSDDHTIGYIYIYIYCSPPAGVDGRDELIVGTVLGAIDGGGNSALEALLERNQGIVGVDEELAHGVGAVAQYEVLCDVDLRGGSEGL